VNEYRHVGVKKSTLVRTEIYDTSHYFYNLMTIGFFCVRPPFLKDVNFHLVVVDPEVTFIPMNTLDDKES